MSKNDHQEILGYPWYATVNKLLPDLNGKKVLEVGCGRGSFSFYLSKKYPKAYITGIDFSDKAIEIARSRFQNQNLAFETGDAEAMSFHESQFDMVISCETMEHVFHPPKMANEIHRVLKRNGTFILTTENYFNGMILAWIKAWITKQPFDSGSGVQPHENFFLFWMVKKYLTSAGLKVSHTESNHFQWLLLPRFAPASLCTEDFENPILKKIFKPFGRHFTYFGYKP